MSTRISKSAREELVLALGGRYRLSMKREKTKILDEDLIPKKWSRQNVSFLAKSL